MQNDLRILNDSAQPATFRRLDKASYIDLTLVSKNMLRHIREWKVLEGITTSDHRVIEIRIGGSIELGPGGRGTAPEGRPGRFLYEKVNRPKFDRYLKTSVDTVLSKAPLETKKQVNDCAEQLTNAIVKACENSMPRKKWRYRCTPWWTPELTREKQKRTKANKRYGKIKKRIRQTENPEIELIAEYESSKRSCKEAARKYRQEIKKAKTSSIRKFITDQGNKNPWGFPYKLQTDKLKVEEVHGNLKQDNSYTKSARETAEFLLSSLIPNAPSCELGSNPRPRSGACPAPLNDEPEFTTKEVVTAVKTLANGKAPGLDQVEVEVLKMAGPIIGGTLEKILNACLRLGVFPTAWKKGMLRALYKGGGKNRSDPRSYRPLCLLPVLGKLLEKLILKKLNETVLNGDKISDRQFGFRTGRSTEDALVDFRSIVQSCEENYALGIFFDISGAFDNVLWPMILDGLRERACPNNVYNLISSYFSERTVSLSWGGGETVTKTTSRGCPQGSVLGPSCWNIVFDNLIRKLEDKIGKNVVVYADDLTVVIEGNSRDKLEKKGQEIVNMISEWCASAGLQLSESKTAMMYVKYIPKLPKKTSELASIRKDKNSKRSRNNRKALTLNKKNKSNSKCTDRRPVIKLNGKTIKYTTCFKLLGVYFDEKLGIKTHCIKTAESLRNSFHKLARLAGKTWGLKSGAMRTIYRGVFVAKATYAARAWHDLACENQSNLQQLIRAQRSALIGVTGAYRTVSTDALPVLAGVLPIKLALIERVTRSQVRAGNETKIGNLVIAAGTKPGDCKNKIKREALRLWQDEWERATHGNTTKCYFPEVSTRIRSKWVTSDHFVAQFLTGHGNFRSWLNSRGKTTGGELCSCEAEETMQHILENCPQYETQRTALMSAIESDQRGWPNLASQLVRKEAFQTFAKFTKEVLTLKEAKNRAK